MKKVALVLGLIVFTFHCCDKQDPTARKRIYRTVSYQGIDKTSKNSQNEKMIVQLKEVGMFQTNFHSLQKDLSKIDIANYEIESNTPVFVIKTLNKVTNTLGFNKMIDNFNQPNTPDNEILMQNYQSFADANCKKIYGCVGADNKSDYEWKIIKFLPNPEKCSLEPTITMRNMMLYN